MCMSDRSGLTLLELGSAVKFPECIFVQSQWGEKLLDMTVEGSWDSFNIELSVVPSTSLISGCWYPTVGELNFRPDNLE